MAFKLYEEWLPLYENSLSKRKLLINELIKIDTDSYGIHSQHPIRIWLKKDKPIETIIEELKQIVLNSSSFTEITDFNIVMPNSEGRIKGKYSSSLRTIEFKLDGEDYFLTINPQQAKGGPTTEEQEKCSIFLFEKALKSKNPNVSDYLKDLEKIFSRIHMFPDWIESFQYQIDGLIEFFRNQNLSNYEFFRESSFTKSLYDHAKKIIGFSSKDSWNPADVWIVDNSNKRINEFLRLETEVEINNYLRNALKSREIVPLSLKKVGNSPVSVQEINMEEKAFTEKQIPSMVNLDLYFDDKLKGFKNNGARIITTTDTIFVLRFSSKTSYSIEAAQKGSKAQLGKVPVDMYRKQLDNSCNIQDWGNNFDEARLKNLFSEIVKISLEHKEISTGVGAGEIENFMNGMLWLFENNKTRYYEKAISMQAIHNLYKRDYQKILGVFYLGAQKIDNDAGPFVKIY
jgi:hypothetical protein